MYKIAQDWRAALFIIFNAGVLTRFLININASLHDDSKDYHAQNKKLLKAYIIVSCISGFAMIISNYYK